MSLLLFNNITFPAYILQCGAICATAVPATVRSNTSITHMHNDIRSLLESGTNRLIWTGWGFFHWSLFKWIITCSSLCILVFFLILTWQYVCILVQRYFGRLPNGPFPLPLVGTVGIDRAQPFKTFEEFAKRYGGLYSCYLGSDLTIVIADANLLRKAFRDIRFAGRPKVTDHYLGLKVENGPVLSEGNIWKEQRHFSIQALREFGFGKRIVEEYIEIEIGNSLQTLANYEGEPLDNSMFFAKAFGNIISYLLFSTDFHSEDPRFKECADIIAVNFQELANASTLDFYPWLRFVPPFRAGFNETKSRFVKIFGIVEELLEQHKKTFDAQHPRDYIDAFLRVQIADDSGCFSGEQLVRNVYDLYAAGFQSTTIFLQWAMLYMICYPEVQQQIQREIDEVIGEKAITFADKISLPYTDATMQEIFRCANFGPFLMPHKTTEKVEFEGYIIPKDTTVFGFAWYCMKDPKLWSNPEKFQPERLLTNNGKVDHLKTENIMPFSVGKRACPGEGFARHEIFIFFASILQHFVIAAEGENIIPSLEPIDGEALTPHPYKMRAIPRQKQSIHHPHCRNE
ncbi:cytochrome P450 2B4-like [Paramacrobiotus metropolitanus]|uniref:cytochrome P450 2B4-like n=1 Tax=Paramacrobiotus metropolitanus TaxID=2943436 RepID=UPI0024464924|nr:cytochrome P450 2B4-like [Paramacrobiotus metropolitanus]XP_055330941.1 cytochrome P450 2B4-like [Paramacrobiotus metropolitanus]